MPRRLCHVAVLTGAMLIAHSGSGLARQAGSTQTGQTAQTGQTTPTGSSDRPIFRTGVDLVRLDLRVTDGSGHSITNLRPDEVRVFDGGVERPVLVFQHIAESGRSFVESAQRTIASEVSTNQGAPRGQLYVLVFDQEHIASGTEQRVRQVAEAFLRERVRPQDRVAIYGLPGPGPSQPFTANVAAAIEQLRLVRGDEQQTLTPGQFDMRVDEAYEILRGNETVATRFMTTTNGTADRTGVLPDAPANKVQLGEDAATLKRLIWETAHQIVMRSDATSRLFLNQFSELLRSFRGVDGRKTVILFSDGFFGDNVGRELTDVASAAAETYSVVYPFDLNTRTQNLGQMALGADQAEAVQSRLNPLGGLALETNGTLVNNAMGHLAQALDTLSSTELDYYIVGFEASPEAVSDREAYRHVDVKVTRPGARVSARTGYAVGPAPTLADRRRGIDAALAAPFTAQGLQVAYTTYVARSDTPGMQGVAVSLEAELPVDRTGQQSADVVFVVRDAQTGQVAASGTDQMPLPSRPDQNSTAGRGDWRVRFDLPAGTYLMRCVVREPGGLVGSADRRFIVRALSGPAVAASDLVLGASGEQLPVRAIAYTDELLAGAVRVYGRTGGQLQSLTATLDLTSLADAGDNGGSPTRVVSGEVGPVHDTTSGVARDVSFAVPVNNLAAGEYMAHAVVRAGGEVVADLRRQVDVVPGAPPAAAVASRAAAGAAPAAPAPREVLRSSVVHQLVEQAASSDDAVVRQAAAEAASGNWTRALALLAPVPAADPAAARLRGLARIDQQDYAGAAAELSSAFLARPTDGGLAFVLGWARVGAGDDTGAASAFRSAAFLEPGLVPAHLALAETYLRLHHPALAAQAIEAGLAKVPQSAELKQMLAKIRQ
jgi:VWFA-related protein